MRGLRRCRPFPRRRGPRGRQHDAGFGDAVTFDFGLFQDLTYYSGVIFEAYARGVGLPLASGGRYDGLFETLGAKPTPAVGWGMGIERVLELIKVQGEALAAPAPDAYAVIPQPQALLQALPVLQALRLAGVSVQMHASAESGFASMKSQFKKADASGARFALVFGEDELAQGCVTVKPLRDGGAQRLAPLQEAAVWAGTLQSKA